MVFPKYSLTLCTACGLVLRFEPDNATAQEFYPVIMERIKLGECPTSGFSPRVAKLSCVILCIVRLHL